MSLGGLHLRALFSEFYGIFVPEAIVFLTNAIIQSNLLPSSFYFISASFLSFVAKATCEPLRS